MHEVIISPIQAHPVTLNLPAQVPMVAGTVAVGRATALAYAPTVTGIRVVVVSAVRATAQGTAYAAAVAGAAGAPGLVVAPIARATARALPPVVTATADATVTAPIATATAVAYAGATGGATSATTFAPLARAIGAAVPAVLTADTVVIAPLATATGLATPATVTGAAPAFAVAPLAAATATAPIPVVSGGNVTVTAVYARAIAGAIAPTTPSGPTVSAPLAAATSTAVAPIIKAEVTVTGGGPAGANAFAIPAAVTVVPPAPAFASLGADSVITGGGFNVDFGVPAGVTGAATQIVLVTFFVRNDSTVITPPTGFTEAVASHPTAATYNLRIYWKRPVAADSGVYTFTFNSLNGMSGRAILYNGCISSGVPIEGAVSAVDPDSTTVAGPPLSTTASGPNRRAVWFAGDPGNSGITFTGGFTERWDTGLVALSDLAISNAGPVPTSGTLVASVSTTTASQMAVWLGLLRSS
jgi:hypothetical protein